MKVLFLTSNYSRYVSGYYHVDWLRAWQRQTDVRIYGPNYPGYNPNHSIQEALDSVGWCEKAVDIIIVSTTWENQNPKSETIDPHPRLQLHKCEGPLKIYFINKEYKRCSEKISWAQSQHIDLVCSSVPELEGDARAVGLNFMSVPFAVDPLRVKMSLRERKRWDLQFTGHLHRNHLDERWLAKEIIFLPRFLKRAGLVHVPRKLGSSKVHSWARSRRIYWAEWRTHRKPFGARVRHGPAYFRFLASSKAAIATKSAIGIVGPRFFELMASGSVPIVPEAWDGNGLLQAGVNCLEAGKQWDHLPEVVESLTDEEYRESLVNSALDWVEQHTYDQRVSTIINSLKNQFPNRKRA